MTPPKTPNPKKASKRTFYPQKWTDNPRNKDPQKGVKTHFLPPKVENQKQRKIEKKMENFRVKILLEK